MDLPYPRGGLLATYFFRHSPSSRKAGIPVSFLKDSFTGPGTSSFGTWKTFCHLPGLRQALPHRLNGPPLTGRGPLLCDSQWPGLQRAERPTGVSSGASRWAPSSTSMELRVRCRTCEVSSHYPPGSCSSPCSLLLRDAEDRPARGWDGSGSCLSQVCALSRSDGTGFFLLLLHLAAKSAPKPWLHPPALGFRLGPSFPLHAEAFCCFRASRIFITACWSVCVWGGIVFTKEI